MPDEAMEQQSEQEQAAEFYKEQQEARIKLLQAKAAARAAEVAAPSTPPLPPIPVLGTFAKIVRFAIGQQSISQEIQKIFSGQLPPNELIDYITFLGPIVLKILFWVGVAFVIFLILALVVYCVQGGLEVTKQCVWLVGPGAALSALVDIIKGILGSK